MESRPQLSGRYRLTRRIASGGQAFVWEAEDRRLGRRVAVKLISPQAAARPAVVERFSREAVAAASLLHPNIAQVYDSGHDNGNYYIVMELLEGGCLKDLLSIRNLSELEAAITGTAIARALAYAHSKGVLHRDVKPSNVILTNTGFPKLTDFGIARTIDSSYEALTADGAFLGTLSYMAPEQILGGPVTEATDIYALGLLLYEALAGMNPRSGATLAQAASLASQPLAPLAHLVDDLDPVVAEIIDACVAPDPASRPGSASEVADVLLPFCSGKTELDLESFRTATSESSTLVDSGNIYESVAEIPRRSGAVTAAPPLTTASAQPTVHPYDQSLQAVKPAFSGSSSDSAPSFPAPTSLEALADTFQNEMVPAGSLIGALRSAASRAFLRLSVAATTAAVFSWIGWRVGAILSYRIARLISHILALSP